MTQSKTLAAASKLLGEKVSAPLTYTPEILVRVPRNENREAYGITGAEFIGFDTWNGYEISLLTNKGLPVSGIGKIVYSCHSEYIVESKSLKLYFNSFNMSRFGDSSEEAIAIMTQKVTEDLSALLETAVEFHFFTEQDQLRFEPWKHHLNMPVLADMIDMEQIEFTHFNESPDILVANERDASYHTIRLQTNMLRSNCRVTHQPDFGSLFLHMEGHDLPTLESLTQYIVSMRGENHFHEEVIEMIFKRLQEKFNPRRLMVTALYARRGGWDICPGRATHPELLIPSLHRVDAITAKTGQQ